MEGVDEAVRIGGRKVPAFAVLQGAIIIVHKDATWKHLMYTVGTATTREPR